MFSRIYGQKWPLSLCRSLNPATKSHGKCRVALKELVYLATILSPMLASDHWIIGLTQSEERIKSLGDSENRGSVESTATLLAAAAGTNAAPAHSRSPLVIVVCTAVQSIHAKQILRRRILRPLLWSWYSSRSCVCEIH